MCPGMTVCSPREDARYGAGVVTGGVLASASSSPVGQDRALRAVLAEAAHDDCGAAKVADGSAH